MPVVPLLQEKGDVYTTNDLHRGRMENQKAKTLICRFIVPYFPVYSPRTDVSHYSDSLHVKAIDVGDVLTQAVLTGEVAKILVRTVLGSRTSVAMRECEQKNTLICLAHMRT